MVCVWYHVSELQSKTRVVMSQQRIQKRRDHTIAVIREEKGSTRKAMVLQLTLQHGDDVEHVNAQLIVHHWTMQHAWKMCHW